MEIRQLNRVDAGAFQALRLSALRDSPTAFASSYEEERDYSLALVAERIAPGSDRFVLGAFDGAELIGCIGLVRESRLKQAHKAYIWGMYVAPAHRGHGTGRQLVERTLQLTQALPGIRQVTLSVNKANAAAISLYAALGFRPFGVEPHALLINGEFYSDTHMVLFIAEGKN